MSSQTVTSFFRDSALPCQELKGIFARTGSRRLRDLERGCPLTAPHPISFVYEEITEMAENNNSEDLLETNSENTAEITGTDSNGVAADSSESNATSED